MNCPPSLLLAPVALTMTLATMAQGPAWQDLVYPPWHLRFDAALAEAQRHGQLVLACLQHEANRHLSTMFAGKEFQLWSKEVVLHLTILGEHSATPSWASSYRAVPATCLLDATGKVVKNFRGTTGDAWSVTLDQVRAYVTAWRSWQALLAAGTGDDEAEVKRLFLLELELGVRPFAELAARGDTLDFSADEQVRVKMALIDLQVEQLLFLEAPDHAAQLVAMFRADRIPSRPYERTFWEFLLRHAETGIDVPLFEDLLAGIRQRAKSDPDLGSLVSRSEPLLESLRIASGKLQSLQKLRADVSGGARVDEALERELLLLEIELHLRTTDIGASLRPFAELQAAREKLKFTGKARKRVDQDLINVQAKQSLFDGAELLVMLRAGRVPEDPDTPEANRIDHQFWWTLFFHAERLEDAKLFEEILGRLRKNVKRDDPWLKSHSQDFEERLKTLRKKKRRA